MSQRHTSFTLVGACAALGLALLSCTDGTQLASGGIGGTGFTQGPIEGFGSIFVAGVEWHTDAAEITVDGVPGAEKDLSVGMVVTITGDLELARTSGTALRVEQDDEIEGPVESLQMTSADELEIEVLGSPVRLRRGLTTFEDDGEGFGFDTIDLGDVVEVDGLTDDAGRLLATHIEKDGELVLGQTEVDLEGVVSNLVPGISFDLGSIRVELGPGTEFEGLAEEELAIGLGVEVEGVLVESDRVLAEEIELRGEQLAGDFEDAEIEGFVTDFAGVSDFRVNGVRVDASGATFEDGGPGDLANGVRVDVEGPVAGGVLVAREVEIEGGEDGDVEGPIEAFVDVSSFEVEGVSIDASGASFNGGTVDDLGPGVAVRVEGDFVGGILVADEVSFRSGSDDD